MLGIAEAIGQIARIFANKTDGDNAIKMHQVKDYKDTDTAMNAAEKHIFAIDSYLNDKISEKQMTYLHKKYKKIFFDNN